MWLKLDLYHFPNQIPDRTEALVVVKLQGKYQVWYQLLVRKPVSDKNSNCSPIPTVCFSKVRVKGGYKASARML